MTITEFLLARIAEDEVEANWVDAEGDNGSSPIQHPARILAECAAKRELVDIWHDKHGGGHVLKTLATVYSDHPDYQPKWAQEG